MDNIINKVREYIKDVTGYDAKPFDMEPARVNALPLFLRNKYLFYKGLIEDHQIVFMYARKDETSANELRKQIDMVQKVFNCQMVFVTDSIKSYNRRRLIDKKIAFVVPGKQMYIPNMLIDLQDFATEERLKPKSMPPATQYLLLYHFLVANLEGIPLKDIAKRIGYGQMTVTRAVSFLVSIDKCQVLGSKEKRIAFFSEKKDLWNEVESFLLSPVKRTISISYGTELSKFKRSNINALANYTLIGDEPKEYYAITQDEFKQLVQSGTIKEYGEYDGEIIIEIWKYNPAGLSMSKYVDPLSLFLTFRNDSDERIQIVLNQMMEDIIW